MDLFLRDGYDATTVAAIARAAGVSHMTYFRHFPTKESVVLDDPYDPVIAERVAGQPAELPALERVRRGLAQSWADVPEPVDAEVRARIRLVAGHPGLRARMWENTQTHGTGRGRRAAGRRGAATAGVGGRGGLHGCADCRVAGLGRR